MYIAIWLHSTYRFLLKTYFSPATASYNSDTTQKPLPASPASRSTEKDFDVCSHQSCSHLKPRPLLELGATVYVVFGLGPIKKAPSGSGHVMELLGGDSVTFDPAFR